ncbi:MAG: hypothetical protein ABIE43_03195 [Patescibacteria group bacterium]
MFNFKKEIAEIKKMAGQSSSSDLKFILSYIKNKYGDKAVDKLINEVEKEIGKVPDYKKLNEIEWLPSAKIHIFIIMATKIFNWGEKDILSFAYNTISLHKLNRWFLRYFISTEKLLAHSQKDHRVHNTQGDFELISCDEKNKKAILRLKGYINSEIFDIYYKGLYLKLVNLNTNSDNVKITVSNCPNVKGVCRDFIISW